MKTFKCKCKYCELGWSFTGFCKPKFCSDQCNANYQKKEVKMELTLEKLIEEIKNRKDYALKQGKETPSPIYWVGYYDALGELLEFIEDNK